ncbi:MAG: hypothetical protein JO092_09445, partial [Candidatus Eremiobacteraeota bacterium]|nr:hypothetical protein [Candidatus Eremiobacteraeota bacterium]
MSQSQTIENNLRALHEQLKDAMHQEDTQAKNFIRTALGRADAIKTDLQSDL